MSQARGLEKAYLESKTDSKKLAFRFNPKEYTISASATWTAKPQTGAEGASKPQFLGTDARQLQMELLFDAVESTSGDVAKDVQQLFDWTCPTPKSRKNKTPQPPVVVLHWGTTSSFDAYLKQVSAKFTLFSRDGKPIRATVNVTLAEAPQQTKRQNPTSGGMAGRRSHMVGEGDTLASVAYAEYGTPTVWRAIAELNSIDDPLRLRTGTLLLLPDSADGTHGG